MDSTSLHQSAEGSPTPLKHMSTVTFPGHEAVDCRSSWENLILFYPPRVDIPILAAILSCLECCTVVVVGRCYPKATHLWIILPSVTGPSWLCLYHCVVLHILNSSRLGPFTIPSSSLVHFWQWTLAPGWRVYSWACIHYKTMCICCIPWVFVLWHESIGD